METISKIVGYTMLILAWLSVAVLGITVTMPQFPENIQELWVVDNNAANWMIIIAVALLLAAAGNFLLKVVSSKLKLLTSFNMNASKDSGIWVEIKETLEANKIDYEPSGDGHIISVYVETRVWKKAKKLLGKSLEYKKED